MYLRVYHFMVQKLIPLNVIGACLTSLMYVYMSIWAVVCLLVWICLLKACELKVSSLKS